jgi:hypothetical protein
VLTSIVSAALPPYTRLASVVRVTLLDVLPYPLLMAVVLATAGISSLLQCLYCIQPKRFFLNLLWWPSP